MNNIRKILLAGIAILLTAFLVLHFVLRGKIKSILKEEAQKGLVYSDLKLNLFSGSASLKDIRYPQEENEFSAKAVEVHGLSYFSLFREEIKVKEIELDGLKVHILQEERKKERKNRVEFDKKIEAKKLCLNQGEILIENEENKLLELENLDLEIHDIQVTKETLTETLPFEYGSYTLTGGNLNYRLNQLQNLRLEKFQIDKAKAVFENVRLIPNYSKTEYVKVIPYEKDLMDLRMRRLTLEDYDLNLKKNRKSLSGRKLKMEEVDFEIYRDKLVKDDPNEKDLYSKMLRDLELTLNIDTLLVENAKLTYEEVQEETGKTAKVFFEEMEIVATQITNKELENDNFPMTKVHINTQFYGVAPLETLWEFKVNNPQDYFRIRGTAQNLPAEVVNNFFTPAFNMRAEGGDISQIYFDFEGNSEMAYGDYKMVYDGFEVEVLNQEEKGSKILSFLANIFVKKESHTNDKPVKVEEVERDKKRSFWNYFWNCVFEGLKETML